MNINALTDDEFIQTFQHIYEHASWVAEHAVLARPFHSLDDMAETFRSIVNYATPPLQLALLRAHPKLGDRIAMTAASTSEQQQAGLQQLDAETYDTLKTLNIAYEQKFQFPFIIAVKGLTVTDILTRIEQRLQLSTEKEFQEALRQVHLIAKYRLEQLIEEGVSYA